MSIRTKFNCIGAIGGTLPSGWMELEYLESTGTQWIDTGIKPSAFDAYEIQYNDTKGIGNAGNYFGVDADARPNYISRCITAYRSTSGTFWYGYGDTEGHGGAVNKVATYRTDTTMVYLTCNGSTVSVNKSGTVTDVSMHLFRANGAAASTAYVDTGLRIYYSVMTRGGSEIQHLVPALDPYGRPCMFDLVTRRPFYNQGTGEFTYKEKSQQ